jgi:integrase
MSVYSVKGKGWRYDFTQKGIRHTEAWFKTKKEAKEAEAGKRQELKSQTVEMEAEKMGAPPTDMAFLELLNLRLDYVRAYKSQKYYVDHIYTSRKLVQEWRPLRCGEITLQMVQRYLIKRARVSAFTANKELRYLRALFNFGIKRGLVNTNPTHGLEFMPVEKKVKYIPSKEDVAKVLLAAEPETQDYLVAIKETMARMGEINRLTWEDVDLDRKTVVLYTRKKKGGHLTPRKVPMTTKLYGMLDKRYKNRDKTKAWVFWGRHWSSKAEGFVEGPYQHRKNLMATLCQRAGVRHFGFHALRHFGASVLERANVPIGSIQRILGHENRTTTEIYLHSIGEAEREAMEVFERATQDGLPTESLTQSLTQEREKVRPLGLTP